MRSFSAGSERRKGQCEIFSCLFFTIASHALHQAFYFFCFRGIFILFYRLPSFHIKQSQGHGTGCRWHTACQLHLRLMDGGLKQNPARVTFYQYRLLLASFYPESEDFQRPVQSSALGISFAFTLLLCVFRVSHETAAISLAV